MEAAKFTAITAIAIIGLNCSSDLEAKRNSNSWNAPLSYYTFCAGLAYGVHALASPEKTLRCFLKFTAISLPFLLGSALLSEFIRIPSLNETGFEAVQSVYQNTHKTLAAASLAWITTRTFSQLDLDPKIAFVFTAMTSALYYAIKPLFNPDELTSRVIRNLTLLGLTAGASKKLLKLDLPFYKAWVIARTCIALFDFIDSSSGFISRFTHGERKYKRNRVPTNIEMNERLSRETKRSSNQPGTNMLG